MQGNKGIAYSTDHKTKRNRLIMYSKYLDLKRKSNNHFLKACANPMKILNDAQHVLRVEANNTSFATIRERFMLPKGKPSLAEVLTAQGRPCLHYLNDMAKPKKNMQLELIMQSQYTDGEFLKMEGIASIIRAAEYDHNVVRSILLSKMSERNADSYWYTGTKGKQALPPIKDYITILAAQDKKQLPGALNNTLQNIIEQLNEDYAL